MTGGRDGDRLPFRAGHLPPRFRRRVVVVAPGRARTFDEIELEGASGRRVRFRCEDILWLTGMPLRALRNHGPEPTVLVAVSRRR